MQLPHQICCAWNRLSVLWHLEVSHGHMCCMCSWSYISLGRFLWHCGAGLFTCQECWRWVGTTGPFSMAGNQLPPLEKGPRVFSLETTYRGRFSSWVSFGNLFCRFISWYSLFCNGLSTSACIQFQDFSSFPLTGSVVCPSYGSPRLRARPAEQRWHSPAF